MDSLLLSRILFMSIVIAVAISPGRITWAAGAKTQTVITTKKSVRPVLKDFGQASPNQRCSRRKGGC